MKDKQKQAQWQAEWFQRNKTAIRLKRQERRSRIRKAIIDYKAQHGCSRCPERDPICLDFHHRNPKTKTGDVAKACDDNWSLERLVAEIKKCIILCANCHRKLESFSRRLF